MQIFINVAAFSDYAGELNLTLTILSFWTYVLIMEGGGGALKHLLLPGRLNVARHKGHK